MTKKEESRKTLADIILAKINEKKTEIQTEFSETKSETSSDLHPMVRKMYRGVGEVMSKYRGGKVPKAFTMIPHLNNWEEVLCITAPQNWTGAAMFEATRIFARSEEKMAQRFYNLILLPRIRDEIYEYKKLNYYMYRSMRKALFKCAAFMKGLLLPLCESGDCTLREAIIIGSVLQRNSIPVLHSSAAILKIAEMEYSGGNSIFLRIFFDKKYALPYKVIDSVVVHFLRFLQDKRQLPVLWHQALLTFVQRYKEDLSSEQKEALVPLLKKHSHYQITPEIRRELANSKCRDVEDSVAPRN